MKQCCLEHSGHASQLKSLTEGQRKVMDTANSAHRRIDTIKNWVIAGMASVMIQLGLTVVKMVINAKSG